MNIVSATGFLLGGYDPFIWRVNIKKARFVSGRRNHIYLYSEIAFNKWLNSLSAEDKVLACDMVFDLLGDTKAVYGLPKALRNIVKKYKEIKSSYSEEEVIRFKEIVKQLIKEYLRAIFV